MGNYQDKKIGEKLDALFLKTPVIRLKKEDNIVVFSDLHMGGGGKLDDFENNSSLFEYILKNYYLKNDFRLILNGDIDELLRFSERSIIKRWSSIYELFLQFNKKRNLVKIFGNHDIELKKNDKYFPGIKPVESIRFDYRGNKIMIFHGHQAGSEFNYNHPSIIKTLMRIFATPLGIKNYSVANNSKKKYVLEKRIYNFAKKKKLVAIIGHTHRPLFESMSKKDNLRFRIEHFCRIYPESSSLKKKELEKKIRIYKKELLELIEKNIANGYIDSLYNTEPSVPCMFNSGSGIGRRGITAIEISEGKIRLMYWFDKSKSDKYFDFNGHKPKRLGDKQYFSVTLKEESLDYIFTRVKLLS